MAGRINGGGQDGRTTGGKPLEKFAVNKRL